ncbi:hypothetical protein QZH41_012809, partial [Actinostola sp. cb2023]
MDPKPFISQGLPFEGGNTMTGLDSDVCKNHNKHTKKDLSSHIEDNLSRLFECLKLEYGRQILVSPKWKNFGSQTLQLSEKTRLNNAIWRCWHIQYQKNKKPLFCQFVSPLSQEREPPKKPLTVILQGRYWRRKLDAIAREYKKWRIYYMKQKNQEQELEDNHERQRFGPVSSRYSFHHQDKDNIKGNYAYSVCEFPSKYTLNIMIVIPVINNYILLHSQPSLKFTRPVSAADRDNYKGKEHRRQSHISAEQKRRFNIKIGFDQLVNLVPALASQKNSKVSKATILQKSADYINKLQRERDKVLEEQQLLRKESQQLFNSISVCQQQLPAFGVPVTRQLAVMFRQMFESYNQKVSGTTWEEFCTSILSWMDEQCTLPTLRP